MRVLPLFQGYTVDCRLREFRLYDNEGMAFIAFDSEVGEKMLCEYIDTLRPGSVEFVEVVNSIL